jgi:hypothetical protein
MKLRPQTIQIFLPSGEPQGIRIAEITTRILQVIEVPRSRIGEFAAMPESTQVSLYFLIGQSDETDEPRVYIGQTGDLRARLANHNKEKDFWERALVVISKTNSLTQTHGVFLEWYCLDACRKADRYSDENANSGSKPYTPAPLEADCLEIFDTAKTLLATLGYPVFEPVAKVGSSSEEDEIFYVKASGADGRGQYTPEGFVVLKGSIGRVENVPSIIGTSLERMRNQLIASGVLRVVGAQLVMEKDHLFKSPSMAAMALMGRNANGWIDWKDASGRTLDQLKRQPSPS